MASSGEAECAADGFTACYGGNRWPSPVAPVDIPPYDEFLLLPSALIGERSILDVGEYVRRTVDKILTVRTAEAASKGLQR